VNEPIDAASIGGVTLKSGSSLIPAVATMFDGDQGINCYPCTVNPEYALHRQRGRSPRYHRQCPGQLPIPVVYHRHRSRSRSTHRRVDEPAERRGECSHQHGCASRLQQSHGSRVVRPGQQLQADRFLAQCSPGHHHFSPDYTTATLQPTSNLASGANYDLFISYFATVYDLAGNRFAPTIVFFTTQ